MSNWFANILPAIESLPKQAGAFNKQLQSVAQQNVPVLSGLSALAENTINPAPTVYDKNNNIVYDKNSGLAKTTPNYPGQQKVDNTANNILNAINPMQMGGPEISAGTDMALPAIKNAAGKTGKIANDAANAYKVSPLSSQAGFIKIGKGAKAAEDIVSKVVSPDAAKSVFGSEKTAAIQDALTRNGVKDYNGVAGAAHNLYDNIIKPALFNSPKPVKIDDVTTEIVNQMRKMKPGIDPEAAKKAAGSVINDMYNISRGVASDMGKGPGGTGGGPLIPTHIDTPALFGIKQDLNHTDAVKNYFSGNPPQDIVDSATVAARNALGKIIQTAHPEVAQATKDYGLLQDSVHSIYKETQQAAKDAANAPKPDPMALIGGKGLDYLPGGQLLHKAGNAVLTNPVGQKIAAGAGLVGGGALGALGLPEIKDSLDNKFTGNAQGTYNQDGGQGGPHNAGIITQPFSAIKPNPDGTYSLPQDAPLGQNKRHYMTAQDYNNQLAQIGQEHTYGTPLYKQAKDQLDAQHSQDQQQAQEVFKGNNIENFMDNATTYNSDGNQLLSTFNSLPPGFWNGVSKAGSVRAYKDPNYASQLQQIDSFNNEFSSAYQAVTGKEPTDNQLLSSANSLKQATTKYIAMMQFISGTYGKYVAPYLALTSGTGTQSQAGTPTNATSKILPPITNDVSSGMLNTPAAIPAADANLPAIQ